MKSTRWIPIALAGAAAGFVTGLFGAGGGMVLVPLLGFISDLREEEIFPTSLSIIVPICIVSLCVTALSHPLPWREAIPYLFGGAIGGLFAGKWGQRIPILWLHRLLGILILWGGIRYLC